MSFANFYCRFIKDFAKLAQPLTPLIKKDTLWIWENDQQKVFDALKTTFRLSTNASNFAVSAILSQFNLNTNLWHLVAFYFKSLNVHKRDYKIYDKELLAIIWALKEYRHYLKGHPEKFNIWSDHQNLIYFKAAQKLTCRQVRWALYLMCFHFSLQYKSEKTMQAEDPLSK